MTYRFKLSLFFIVVIAQSLFAQDFCVPITVSTIYGKAEISEPVIIELLASQAMERLKHINQHGINDIVRPEFAFSRYEHSVGVFFLTRMFGADLHEQVAALLHDASHTVFSHVGDLVFAGAGENGEASAYQDDIHEWYIAQTDVAPILARYGMTHVVSDAAKNEFRLLEQEYPDICADRLDYVLRTARLAGLITASEIIDLLAHLHFEQDKWYFDDATWAKKFSDCCIWLTRFMYGAPWNIFLYKLASDAFKHALQIGVVTAHEMHFSYDEPIWQCIVSANDALLQQLLRRIDCYEDGYAMSDGTDYDYMYRPKCRVVDPLVKTETGFKRLSDVDPVFAVSYQEIRRYCDQGVYLKFKDIA